MPDLRVVGLTARPPCRRGEHTPFIRWCRSIIRTNGGPPGGGTRGARRPGPAGTALWRWRPGSGYG